MAPCRHQQIIEANALNLFHTPRRNPLASDPVLENRRLLEQQDALARAGHDRRESGSTDTAADHDEIKLFHEVPQPTGCVITIYELG